LNNIKAFRQHAKFIEANGSKIWNNDEPQSSTIALPRCFKNVINKHTGNGRIILSKMSKHIHKPAGAFRMEDIENTAKGQTGSWESEWPEAARRGGRDI
jgi:hypothetical protein